MQRTTTFAFNDVAKYTSPSPVDGLVFAIRTDAHHATDLLKKNLLTHLQSSLSPLSDLTDLEEAIKARVHEAYRIWGHDILNAMSECLDYASYGIQDPSQKYLQADFYNARDLAEEAIEKAAPLLEVARPRDGVPAVYVSLDSMIERHCEHEAQIAFSRLFSLDGTQSDYVARPGSKPIGEQMDDLRIKLQGMKEQYGCNVPFILMEDNVRFARMLNWVIGKMEEHGVFEHGVLAGISTCFCCATPQEREAIKYKGQTVPLAVAVDYKDAKVDVMTPRDLLFDGLVVEINGKTARLPGLFMDVQQRFKIDPQKTDEFCKQVQIANMEFCYGIQHAFDVTIPLSWFPGAEAIAHVTKAPLETPMTEIMFIAAQRQAPRAPAPVPVPAP